MRPYLTVIHDSFREAIASRVLWILFILVTAFLFAIALIDDREHITTQLRTEDVSDWNFLLAELTESTKKNTETPARRIWKHFNADQQRRILAISSPSTQATVRNIRLDTTVLIESLNAAIEQRNLYDERAWHQMPLAEEAKMLLQRGVQDLAPLEVERLNRLLIEAAFPQVIRKSPSSMVTLTMMGRSIQGFPAISRERLRERVISALLLVMQVLVGNVAIFVAILVTAPIVPQTFSSGSLNLLLSKPISRSLLLLSKYLGGCAFVILISSYLILGLWLIVGWRFDVWQHRLLLCIPIFAFVFSISYSLSTLVGVIYKSAIISVISVILLWSLCWMVGVTHYLIERSLIDRSRTINMIPGPHGLMRVNERGMTFLWNTTDNNWKTIFISAQNNTKTTISSAQMEHAVGHLGPIYDAQHERLLLIPGSYGDIDALVTKQLLAGNHANHWKPVVASSVPSGSKALLLGRGQQVLLIASRGIFRLSGPSNEIPKRSALFEEIPQLENELFQLLGPSDQIDLGGSPKIAVHRDTGAIAIWNNGILTLLELDSEQMYHVTQTRPLQVTNDPLLLGFAGDTLLLAGEDGQIQLFDSSTFNEQKRFQPEHNNQPRFVTSSSDGRWFAVVYHHRRLVLVDTKNRTVIRRGIRGQGDISAAIFSEKGKLLVADRVDRITQYQLDPIRQTTEVVPRLHWMERMHRYAVVPLYWMLPKPSELNHTIFYLLTGRETVNGTNNPASAQEQVKPWKPLWSSLAFVIAVLAIACLYIERAEF